MFDDASTYAGKVTAYDSPIYIADAALYLMKHPARPRHQEPLRARPDQLAAAVDLLKAQRANVGEYWSDYLKEVQSFETGDSVIGTTWQVIEQLGRARGRRSKAILPEEGSTGWSDTWMIAAKAKHPNCAYAWLDYITSPKAQAAVAEYFGEAPANSKACALPRTRVLRRPTTHGRRLRREDLVLDDPDRAVPRRPHRREVHRLRRLDARPGPRSRADRLVRCSVRRPPGRCRAGPAARATAALAGRGLPRGAGGVAHHRVLEPNAFTGDDRARPGRSTTIVTWSPIAVYRTITLRTSAIAAAGHGRSTSCSRLPIAFFMAKVASPRGAAAARDRGADAAVGVLPGEGVRLARMLSRAACRLVLQPFGAAARRATACPPTVITLAYLWLPYMILPIYAGLERVPDSLLEASGDLGGEAWHDSAGWCCRWPSRRSSPARSSRFSLTLGDYIAVKIVGGTNQMLGNLVYTTSAPPTTCPSPRRRDHPGRDHVVYLAAVRRTGALDNL